MNPPPPASTEEGGTPPPTNNNNNNMDTIITTTDQPLTQQGGEDWEKADPLPPPPPGTSPTDGRTNTMHPSMSRSSPELATQQQQHHQQQQSMSHPNQQHKDVTVVGGGMTTNGDVVQEPSAHWGGGKVPSVPSGFTTTDAVAASNSSSGIPPPSYPDHGNGSGGETQPPGGIQKDPLSLQRAASTEQKSSSSSLSQNVATWNTGGRTTSTNLSPSSNPNSTATAGMNEEVANSTEVLNRSTQRNGFEEAGGMTISDVAMTTADEMANRNTSSTLASSGETGLPMMTTKLNPASSATPVAPAGDSSLALSSSKSSNAQSPSEMASSTTAAARLGSFEMAGGTQSSMPPPSTAPMIHSAQPMMIDHPHGNYENNSNNNNNNNNNNPGYGGGGGMPNPPARQPPPQQYQPPHVPSQQQQQHPPLAPHHDPRFDHPGLQPPSLRGPPAGQPPPPHHLHHPPPPSQQHQQQNLHMQGYPPHPSTQPMQQQHLHHHHHPQGMGFGNMPSMGPPSSGMIGPPGMAGGPPSGNPSMGGAPGMKELRVEDALLYLDDVKREFKDRPAIYNEFLAIMKNFKSQEVDTPGVINRVSNLFRGYNKLILGFNTFLPEGYKISLADLERVEQMRQQAEERASREKKPSPLPPHQINISQEKSSPPMMDASMMPKQQQQQQHEWVQSPPPPHPQGIKQLPVQGLQQQQQQQRTSPGAVPSPTPRGGQQQQQQQQQHSTPSQPQQQQQQQQHQAVEFDHAISYVTTIKRRFANDSNTYHTFLEILHTYQKEQRGIKEVLEQVAHLFQDHPDLLKEFTFFLPDAVQEQAKERLHRAAAESENRLLQRQMAQYQQRVGKGASASTAAVGSPSVAAVPASKTSEASNSFIDMTRSQMAGTAADSSERGAAGGRKRATPEVTAAAQLPTPPPPPQQQQQYQPEVYVYNSAVERQFFDTVREALSSHARDGGQAWAEFLKCMDMYAQEILSRTEMLNCVEPLLGKRHSNLLEDFKRILSAAGSPSVPQLMEDSWHSVPLSEIDFSRCRRCSPSYRALPRDYPPHPCSERSDFETKVLNDIWVSLPVGSEESYTFRHMRRNTHEEMLFRVEDERFEIDMAIDSNAATLQRLEPIAEEIALLAQEDVIPGDLGVKSPIDGVGIGGKRYQYIFDKKILGVHHRNSITRIYGDLGQEMLDLLAKNPTVAVPLVVQRLRQKDQEWRQVRKRLNRHWREIQEHNYYRSLDHRSLSWRSSDKRAISARTLIADIKDRAANRGREGKEALRQKLDKAKEERGQFYEVTVGDLLTTDLDLTFLPKSDRRLFTPHLSLLYKNVSWAQRDAYRIMAFALERGPISPSDKERCHRLWVEFFGPWFDLPLSWMQKPAVTYQDTAALKVSLSSPEAQVVSEEDEESMEDRPDLAGKNVVSEPMKTPDLRDREFTDHHPLPAGAHVSSIYGEGKIIEFRREDHIYAVKLPFGTGYLRPATVLCSMLPVEKSAYTRQLRAEDRTKLARPNDQLAFGTQSLYLFFRLHQILVDRLNTAKRLAYSVGEDRSLQTMVSQMPDANPKAVGRQRYEAYLSLVYSLLDGGAGLEGGRYEDLVRSLLGHGAYELATMDKLISHIWKDIQAMANDETMWNLVQLYRRHLLAGSFQPEAFRQEAAYLSDGEQMYAFQHCPVPSTDESVLHMEYLGVMDDDDDEPMEDDIEPIEQPPVNKRQKR